MTNYHREKSGKNVLLNRISYGLAKNGWKIMINMPIKYLIRVFTRHHLTSYKEYICLFARISKVTTKGRI